MDKFFEFYSRREVQARILETAEDREVAPRYNQGFGRRPDVLQFPGDILEMAKKGATSFHISEERWENPLNLKPGMAKSALDENRKGWDLILDIDTSYWYGAKLTSYLLIEALKFQDVKNIYCKFSVTGDTPILIRKDKETRLLSIREVIKLLKKEEEIEVLSLNKEN
ncbi:MAG: hypothetical protein Q8Q35_00760 [Nanoarchaeota archaeon]|nr:hypothetical protein [Nanoarchaeota archaeon]